MYDGLLQIARMLSMAGHGPEKTGKMSANHAASGVLWVIQNLSRFMDPTKSSLYARPQRRRFVQTAINQVFQPVEFFREPLFAATRSRL